MKQDIMLALAQTNYLINVCEALRDFGMKVFQIDGIEHVNAGLVSHSPAFLLIDMDIEGAEALLNEMAKNPLYPPPYIIAADTFFSVSECIAVLNLGADAYINKPISADEVLAIIKTVLRRERKIARLHIGRLLPCIEYKDLLIDPLRRIAQMRGIEVELTEKEFDILHLLAYHSGNVLTREEIYEATWRRACGSSAASVSGHIFSIRQKLGLGSKDKDYIQTVFGVGYRFARME